MGLTSSSQISILLLMRDLLAEDIEFQPYEVPYRGRVPSL